MHFLRRASNLISPHTIYAYVVGLLLTLVEIKYQGSINNPFHDHPSIMLLFLITQFVYVISLFTFLFDWLNERSRNFNIVVCHVFGTLACQLLLLVLVSPVKWFLVNVSSLVLVVATFLCYSYLLHLLNNASQTQRLEIDRNGDGQATEMVDVEAEVTSSSWFCIQKRIIIKSWGTITWLFVAWHTSVTNRGFFFCMDQPIRVLRYILVKYYKQNWRTAHSWNFVI